MDDTADLDTNAFLQSVRELKEKRQREDNERQEQLEAQIASSRLARKLEREREMTASPPASPSMSPSRASPSGAMPSRANTFSRQPRSRPMSVDMGSPTRASSVRPMSMMSIPEQGTPLPSRDSQRFAPPETDSPASPGVGRTMSNAQSRIERPTSPTKGMGGFVQSAMLKRTDSVNKRWSNPAGPSALGRHDSTASFRSATNADDTESRPTSSHSTISNLNIAPDTDAKEKTDKPIVTRHSRSRSMASFSGQEPIPEGLMSPPLSPNKRWSRSPTKASWLESALSRPESPKPLASPQANQPSWMAEITKAKQQRGTAENSPAQENGDAAKAQDTPPIGQNLLKRSSLLRNTPAHSPSSSRNVTPPTKAKPASLIAKSTAAESSTPILNSTKKEPEASEPEKVEPVKEPLPKEEPVEEKAPVDTHESKPTKPAPLKSLALSTAPALSPKPQSSDSRKSPASSSSSRFPALKSPELRSSEMQSPELKQDTTPKTDFRSGLKSRSGTIGAQSQEEPEFKALFGKLKKAQTEKYVAPDELKNNILRGKAGLSLSAGPQKSERRDELKESLQKRKEEMNKAATEKPAAPKISNAPSAVPEALSIRKQLGRSNSTLNVPAPDKSRRDITPEALSFHKNLRGKAKAPVPEKRSSVIEKVESKRTSTDAQLPAAALDKKPAEEAPAVAGGEEPERETYEPLETKQRELPKPEKQELPKPEQQEFPKPMKQEQIKPSSNKFADRFNPGLAGLLARGPPQASNPSTPRSGSPFSPSAVVNVQHSQSADAEDGAQLTHMTKSRAKGPKRRKPQSSAAPSTAKTTPEKRISSSQSAKTEEQPSSNLPMTKTPMQPRPKSAAVRAASINLSKPPATEPEKPKEPTPTKVSIKTSSPAQTEKLKESVSIKQPERTPGPIYAEKPKTASSIRSSSGATESAELQKPKPVTPAKPALNTLPTTVSENTKPLTAPAKVASPASGSPLSSKSIPSVVSPISARKISVGSNRPLPAKPLPSLNNAKEKIQEKPLPPVSTTESNKENQSFSSVKNVASMWGRSTQQTPPRKSGPIELPTKKDEDAAMMSAGLLSSSPLRYKASPPKLGLGISDNASSPVNRSNGKEQTPPTSAGAPPKPAKSSRIVSGQLSAKDLPLEPDALQLPAGRELFDFFGEIPKSHNQLQLSTDTQTVLRSRPGETDKIKTLRASIQEIKSDGTLIPQPAQQEHILYENSMYICSHIYHTANMTRMAEVYLWCGDGIQETTIMDTQVHARKIAKEAGVGQKSTQLYIIDQAREPAGFFQALGGLVITRRGSRADNQSPYMLCGRPHIGHIAFDEVDRSKASLCSEYPYIVARPVTLQETKVWLWKGSGCGPAAIGGARLISMELDPSGNFTELDEGSETPEFLQTIRDPERDICKSPALWNRANASWDHSSIRLFKIEASAPKQTATSLFTSFISSRRPSWSAPRSPERPPSSSSPTKSPTTPPLFNTSISEIAPFTQDDFEAEGCYILDAGSSILVLPGPLLSKQLLWQHAFVQAALFAHDYAILSASAEDRPGIPRAGVVLGGLARDVKVKFRRWEDKRGIWGTAGLLAGRRSEESGDVVVDVRDVLEVCCESQA